MKRAVLRLAAAAACAGCGGSASTGVNENDIAVGLASAPHVAGYEAVIFRGNGVIEELGTLGGLRGQANAINNHDLVVGVSDVDPKSYDMHGFFAVDGQIDRHRQGTRRDQVVPRQPQRRRRGRLRRGP